MSYYSPSFAALDQGWYFSTDNDRYASERDECLQWWNKDCDRIVEAFIKRYGMFFRAFIKDIEVAINQSFEVPRKFPDYFAYFVVSRTLLNPEIAAVYLNDYELRSENSIVCTICNTHHKFDDIHPTIIRKARRVLPLCNTCGFLAAHFSDLGKLASINDELKARIRGLSESQFCATCRKQFTWNPSKNRFLYGIPLLPRRYTQICPRCIADAAWGSRATDHVSALDKLKRISEIIGGIPSNSAFSFDSSPTLAGAIEIISLLKNMPPLHELSKTYGSWFKTLIAAGILPEGSRRTHYGTFVLAKDGHECNSLAEKTIDDLLTQHQISHEKEVLYPGFDYRADWKITLGRHDLYIELFGLDGQPQYTRRMRQKIALAKQIGIQLVYFDRHDLNDLRRAFEEKILNLIPKEPGP